MRLFLPCVHRADTDDDAAGWERTLGHSRCHLHGGTRCSPPLDPCQHWHRPLLFAAAGRRSILLPDVEPARTAAYARVSVGAEMRAMVRGCARTARCLL